MSAVLRPDRGRVVDPVLVGLVALVVVALHGYGGVLNRDLGVFTYGGLHVVDGVPPYVGIFNSVGPLADLVPALGIWAGRLGGLDPVLSERLLFSLLTAGCCALVCVLARDVFGSRAASLVAPAVLLTFRDFLYLASDGPREKTTMVLLLTAALILVVRRHWLAAGACTALATLTWQPALLPACVTALVGLAVVPHGRRLRAAGAFVLGGTLPTAVAVAYFAVRHDLRVALDGFVLINLEFTHQPSLVTHPHQTLHFLTEWYRGSLWLVVAGLVALVALAVAALVPRPPRITVLAVAAGGIAATIWTIFVINGAPDLFVVLPFAALGVAGTVGAAVARLQPWHGWALAGVVTAAAMVAATTEAVTSRDDRLAVQRADVAAVLATAPPHAGLVSINAPEVMVLAGRDNPSPFQIFNGPMERYIDHTQPGGLRGYDERVDRQHPTLIAVYGHTLPWWAVPVLGRDYVDAGAGPGWSWWVARSEGHQLAAAVRAANRSVVRPGS